jgi:hypothetical protein
VLPIVYLGLGVDAAVFTRLGSLATIAPTRSITAAAVTFAMQA